MDLDFQDQFVSFKDKSGNKITTRVGNIVLFIQGSSLERPSQMDPLAGSHRIAMTGGIQSVVDLTTLQDVQKSCGISFLEH